MACVNQSVSLFVYVPVMTIDRFWAHTSTALEILSLLIWIFISLFLLRAENGQCLSIVPRVSVGLSLEN